MFFRLPRPIILSVLTVFLIFVLLAWFVLEILIHSLPQTSDGNDYDVGLLLAEISLQMFMYTGVLTLASLTGCWYCEYTRTQASRGSAATVATFVKSAWLFELWFVLPVYYADQSNPDWFCSGQPYYTGLTNPNSDWCHLAKGTMILSLCAEVAFLALWGWSLIVRFYGIVPEIPIPTHSTLLLADIYSRPTNSTNARYNLDINWRTVLTDPEDLELATITAAFPEKYGRMRARINRLGLTSTGLNFVTLCGYFLYAWPTTIFSNRTGLSGWITNDRYNNVGFQGWGDPIIAGNWYWIMLSLGFSLALTSFVSTRSNRRMVGTALFAVLFSALQFWSFFIYSARRLNGNARTFVAINQLLGDTGKALYAEIAGAALILISSTLHLIILLIRYFLYIPITAEEHAAIHIPSHIDTQFSITAHKITQKQTPSFIPYRSNGQEEIDMSEQNSNSPTPPPISPPPRSLSTATAAAASIMKLPIYISLTQIGVGPFHQVINIIGPNRSENETPENNSSRDVYVPSYNMGIFDGTSISFRILSLIQLLLFLIWTGVVMVNECLSGIFSEFPGGTYNNDESYYYNEKMYLQSSLLAAGTFLAATVAENTIGSISASLASFCNSIVMLNAFFLLVYPFAYQSVYREGELYTYVCDVSSADWCNFTKGSGILALLQGFLLLFMVFYTGYRFYIRYRTTKWEEFSLVSIILSVLILVALTIWGVTTVSTSMKSDNSSYYQQYQSVPIPFINSDGDAIFTEGYWATQSFFVPLLIAITLWITNYSINSVYIWQRSSWRLLAVSSASLLAMDTLPMAIYSARFINTLVLNSAQSAFASAIFILYFASVAYSLNILFLMRNGFYAPLHLNVNSTLAQEQEKAKHREENLSINSCNRIQVDHDYPNGENGESAIPLSCVEETIKGGGADEIRTVGDEGGEGRKTTEIELNRSDGELSTPREM